jgi:hypothetical protein
MTGGVFDDASMVSTIVRVRDVAASVVWYREKNDRNSYVVVVMNGDLEPARRALIDRGVDVGEVRQSANNEFVWFHDLDGNRFELSRPL